MLKKMYNEFIEKESLRTNTATYNKSRVNIEYAGIFSELVGTFTLECFICGVTPMFLGDTHYVMEEMKVKSRELILLLSDKHCQTYDPYLGISPKYLKVHYEEALEKDKVIFMFRFYWKRGKFYREELTREQFENYLKGE